MSSQRVIILFVKYPEKGRVKTRLARTMGAERAVSIYRQLVDRLIRMLRSVDVEEIRICFDPEEQQDEVESWLRPIWLEAGAELAPNRTSNEEIGLVFRSQCEGDLGDRLKSAFSIAFHENEEKGFSKSQVIAIGSDCIDMDDHTFQAAWQELETNDVVFGPTFDGGYYLLGMKSYYPVLFEKIPWSTEKTMEVSLVRARDSGLKTEVMEKKHDIDTEEDWLRADAKFDLKGIGEQAGENSEKG